MDVRRQKLRRTLIALAFLALPITLNYYSPYLMTQGMAERIATFSLLLWLSIFATSFVLGRSFCGWICPFNGLQQLWESVTVRPLKRVRFLPVVKYVLWAAWVGAVAVLAIRTGGWRVVRSPLHDGEWGVGLRGGQPGDLLRACRTHSRASRTRPPRFLPVPVPVRRVGHRRRAARGLGAHPAAAARRRCRRPAPSCGACTRACPMQLPVTEMVQAEPDAHDRVLHVRDVRGHLPESTRSRSGSGRPGALSARADGLAIAGRIPPLPLIGLGTDRAEGDALAVGRAAGRGRRERFGVRAHRRRRPLRARGAALHSSPETPARACGTRSTASPPHSSALRHLDDRRPAPDVVLLDVRLAEGERAGIEGIPRLRAAAPARACSSRACPPMTTPCLPR